jgi:hypothetical protein
MGKDNQVSINQSINIESEVPGPKPMCDVIIERVYYALLMMWENTIISVLNSFNFFLNDFYLFYINIFY